MKAQFFLFNIEGYGEFFSGITPSNYIIKYFIYISGCPRHYLCLLYYISVNVPINYQQYGIRVL